MTEQSYGLDFLLVYSWDWWENRQNTGKVTLAEDYKDDESHKAAQTPFSIKDSGPTEFNQTQTLPKAGSLPAPLAQTELAMIEVCPVCQETLQLYSTKDILSKHKVFRCKNCGTILVKSSMGWITPE